MNEIPGSTKNNTWVVVRDEFPRSAIYRNDFKDESEARIFAARMRREGYIITIVEPDGYMMNLC